LLARRYGVRIVLAVRLAGNASVLLNPKREVIARAQAQGIPNQLWQSDLPVGGERYEFR